jgi:uncharacterized protein (TIGR00299 family) protein
VSRIAYLDCVGGAAGDMLVAALLDAGADRALLDALPPRLGLEGIEIRIERVERQGVGATHVSFPSTAPDPHRDWRTIRAILDRAELPGRVKARSLEVFTRLAEAEARVHGIEVDDVHFHELGAADTLMDICGAVSLVEDLGLEYIACSPLPVAGGVTRAAHGLLPLPSPATLELLRGAPLHGVETTGELVTPTGAALVSTLASRFGPLPPLTLGQIGVGAGTRDSADRPNVLRVLVGTAAEAATGEIVVLETNLDDLNPELVPDAVERCFAAGALDVWTVAAQMKKGRPGFVLSALARPADQQAVALAILEETSALGVRVSHLPRYELERREEVVDLDGGHVRVKIGELGGRVVNVAPEHDDCAAVARATGRSVKSVWAAALAAAGST